MKIQRAYGIDSGEHVFSIIVNKKKISYVFASKKLELFDPKARVERLFAKLGDRADNATEDELLSLAKVGLSNFRYGPITDADDFSLSVAREKLSIKQSHKNFVESQKEKRSSLSSASERIYEVLQDFPDLEDALWVADARIPSEGMFEVVMAALDGVDPKGPNAWLIDYMDGKEPQEGDIQDLVLESPSSLTAAASPDECPPATQDILLNIENRQNAIDNVGYGPLNPNEPNEEFWQKKAERWSVSIEDAKKSTCGNCAAFIRTTKMLDCISEGLQEGDKNVEDSYDVIVAGELGYCEALDFKCAASRTCDAWIAGGPVTDETGKEETGE